MMTEKMSLKDEGKSFKNVRIGYKYLLCRQTIKAFEIVREGGL
jgi:hypothetical protein